MFDWLFKLIGRKNRAASPFFREGQIPKVGDWPAPPDRRMPGMWLPDESRRIVMPAKPPEQVSIRPRKFASSVNPSPKPLDARGEATRTAPSPSDTDVADVVMAIAISQHLQNFQGSAAAPSAEVSIKSGEGGDFGGAGAGGSWAEPAQAFAVDDAPSRAATPAPSPTPSADDSSNSSSDSSSSDSSSTSSD